MTWRLPLGIVKSRFNMSDLAQIIFINPLIETDLFFQLQLGDHGGGIKRYKIRQPTKKMNCPAQIVVREILMFPQFKVRHYYYYYYYCVEFLK